MRPEWIDDEVQDHLEWQLRKIVETKWQRDWVEHLECAHHEVIVERKSLISNEELLQVHKSSQEWVAFLHTEGICESSELDCHILVNWVAGLKIDGVNSIVGHNDSIEHDVNVDSGSLNDSKPEVHVVVSSIEIDRVTSKNQQHHWSNNTLQKSEPGTNLCVQHIPSSVYIVDTALKTSFNWWCSD